MARNIRVLRPAPAPPRYRELLDLCEDAQRLTIVIGLLQCVDANHIASVETVAARKDCEDDLRITTTKLKRWQRFALDRIRKEFLTE
jgi:hypothetical protein